MGRLSTPARQEHEKLLEYVREYKRDATNQIAFEAIVVSLGSYLTSVTKKFFYVAGNNSDDIYQEALCALATKAIPDYDEKKGSFIAFAKLCIRRHIITVLKATNSRKNSPLNKSVPFDAPANGEDEEDGPSSIGGFLATSEEGVVEHLVRNESHNSLRMLLMGKLTGLESEILDLYLQNFSYVDIVRLMNRQRRGRRRVGCKTIDNALCRVKKKAAELSEAMRKERGSVSEEES